MSRVRSFKLHRNYRLDFEHLKAWRLQIHQKMLGKSRETSRETYRLLGCLMMLSNGKNCTETKFPILKTSVNSLKIVILNELFVLINSIAINFHEIFSKTAVNLTNSIMALRGASKLFAMRRIQSVPVALYHANVSAKFYYEILFSSVVMREISRNCAALSKSTIFDNFRSSSTTRTQEMSARWIRRIKMLEPASSALQLAAMWWNFR